MNSIEKANAALQAKREAGEPVHIRNKAEIFATNNTRKTAIDLFCCHCMGQDFSTKRERIDGNYRDDIRNCSCGPESSLPCSLYEWRPYK